MYSTSTFSDSPNRHSVAYGWFWRTPTKRLFLEENSNTFSKSIFMLWPGHWLCDGIGLIVLACCHKWGRRDEVYGLPPHRCHGQFPEPSFTIHWVDGHNRWRKCSVPNLVTWRRRYQRVFGRCSGSHACTLSVSLTRELAYPWAHPKKVHFHLSLKRSEEDLQGKNTFLIVATHNSELQTYHHVVFVQRESRTGCMWHSTYKCKILWSSSLANR